MPSGPFIEASRDTLIGAPDTRAIIRRADTIITIRIPTTIPILIVTSIQVTDCAGTSVGLHVRCRRVLPASTGSAAGDPCRGKRPSGDCQA